MDSNTAKPQPLGKCCRGKNNPKCSSTTNTCVNGEWACGWCNVNPDNCAKCSQDTNFKWCDGNTTSRCPPPPPPPPPPSTTHKSFIRTNIILVSVGVLVFLAIVIATYQIQRFKNIKKRVILSSLVIISVITTGIFFANPGGIFRQSGGTHGGSPCISKNCTKDISASPPPKIGKTYYSSTTMYTPIESANPTLGYNCNGLATIPQHISCSSDSLTSAVPHVPGNCGSIQLFAEKLAQFPTPKGVIGWVALARASPMHVDPPTNPSTAYAPPGSCWELTISPINGKWSEDNNNLPACASTKNCTTQQKLYGVVVGKCPCTDNGTWCCCTGGTGTCGGGSKCSTYNTQKTCTKNSPCTWTQDSVATYNHFDIWLPGCSPGKGGTQCYSPLYCGKQPNCDYCPERDYPCWSSIQQQWGAYKVGNTEKLAWDTMQNWNVTIQEIKIPPEVSTLLSNAKCIS